MHATRQGVKDAQAAYRAGLHVICPLTAGSAVGEEEQAQTLPAEQGKSSLRRLGLTHAKLAKNGQGVL